MPSKIVAPFQVHSDTSHDRGLEAKNYFPGGKEALKFYVVGESAWPLFFDEPKSLKIHHRSTEALYWRFLSLRCIFASQAPLPIKA